MLSPYQFILCSAFARVKDKLLEQKILTSGVFKVMAITNAADFDKIEGEPLRRVDEDIDALTSLGYEVTDVDLRQETQTSLAEKLPQYDAVFVSGGNTFWLLECMKKSGFTALIREFLKKGIYISTSAGSCVCAPNIEYVKYADDPSVASLSEYTGLNFVNVGIIPHFNAKKGKALPEERIQELDLFYQGEVDFPVICLSDTQAIAGHLEEGIKIIS